MTMPSVPSSIITTSSGMLGGVVKAISSGFTLCRISFPHFIEVVVYAAISAFVGYMVKLGIDTIRNRVINQKKRNN